METTQIIPQIAWEQAVYICLFILVIVWMSTFFGKLSEKWQTFIESSNEKWRAFNREQRAENNCRMEEVNKAINNLTLATQSLVIQVEQMGKASERFYTEFQAHDDQAKEILGKVTKPVRKQANGNGNSINNKEQ